SAGLEQAGAFGHRGENRMRIDEQRPTTAARARKSGAFIAFAAAALACTAAAVAQPPIARAPAWRGTALVAAPTTGWPTNGGNWHNQRYSPLTAISRANVASLKGVWRTHLEGSGLGTKYSGEAQPIVHEGIAYVITGADDVFALSIETGAILWSYKA